MKQTPLLIIATLILATIFSGFLFTYSIQTARNNVNIQICHALKQSMKQDLELRTGQISHSQHRKGKQAKTKCIELTEENPITHQAEHKRFTFKDSINVLTAQQMLKQYISRNLNPIHPDSLLKLFTAELNRLRISVPAGIIYQNGEQRFYSRNDSSSHLQASFVTELDSFDLSNQLKLTAWADYGIPTVIRFMNIWGYIGIILCIASLAVVFLLFSYHLVRVKSPKKQNSPTTKEHQDQPLKERIILPQKCIAIIDGKQYKLPKKDYELLHFFMSNIASPISTESIQKKIWPSGVITNVYVHINNLNKILHPHSLDIEKSSAGYQLIIRKQENAASLLP